MEGIESLTGIAALHILSTSKILLQVSTKNTAIGIMYRQNLKDAINTSSHPT